MCQQDSTDLLKVDPTTNNVTYTEYAPNAQAISLVGDFSEIPRVRRLADEGY